MIAHRGASGERPEHTLAAYRLAIAQGADVIEPDLVMTRDGVLVARHDVYLSTTTDVASRAAFRHRARLEPELRPGPDWFAADFELHELQSLRAVQPFPGRDARFDGRFGIPTFTDVLALADEESRRSGRRIGVYPETKAPGWHAVRGLPMAEALLGALAATGFDPPSRGVLIQSFEAGILEALRPLTRLPLVQLLAAADGEAGPIDLARVRHRADGIGPAKGLLLDGEGRSTGLVEAAHRHGLFVHPWTFRSDQLPAGIGTLAEELAPYLALGIDGFFTDFPKAGRAVVDRLFP